VDGFQPNLSGIGNGTGNPSGAKKSGLWKSQNVQVNINIAGNTELFVLFGVKGWRRTLELAQIDVSKHMDDDTFFQALLKEYRNCRGFLRYWLSVWQFQYCDFVKVSLLWNMTARSCMLII
jgi:hypothetical protein